MLLSTPLGQEQACQGVLWEWAIGQELDWWDWQKQRAGQECGYLLCWVWWAPQHEHSGVMGCWMGVGVVSWLFLDWLCTCAGDQGQHNSTPFSCEIIASGGNAWCRHSSSPMKQCNQHVIFTQLCRLTKVFPSISISWCHNLCISYRINNIPSHLGNSTRPIQIHTVNKVNKASPSSSMYTYTVSLSDHLFLGLVQQS